MTMGIGQDYDPAFDATGAPVLLAAEMKAVTTPALFMYRWSAATWDSMSGPSVGGTHLPRQVRLLIDGHGRRLDAWTETNDQYTGVVRVARTWR